MASIRKLNTESRQRETIGGGCQSCCDKKISARIKEKVCKTVVRSTLLYVETETLALKKVQEKVDVA